MRARNSLLTNQNPDLIFVAHDSRPVDVGGAIAHTFRNKGAATVQAIGPHTVNQAVKALIIAADHLQAESMPIVFIPSFHATVIEGNERTAVRFAVLTAPQGADGTERNCLLCADQHF